MRIDSAAAFEPVTGTAITASANSSNVLDLLTARDMGGGHYPDPELMAICLTSFAGPLAATLTIQVQAAPDNGNGSPGGFQPLFDTGAMGLGQLVAGMKLLQADLSSVSQPIISPTTTTFTCSSGVNTITVASVTGLGLGMLVVPATAGIVTPGTTITGINTGTRVVTLSANTTGAAAAGSGISFAPGFGTSPTGGLPRFLQLNYVVASGPFTAGTIWAGIVLDDDQQPIYPAGYVFPKGT
jgi:hypothetical protein